MTVGQRWLKINGQWCLATDVGCPDFEAARLSRLRQKSTDGWWQQMEQRRDASKDKDLPNVVPVNWGKEKNDQELSV